MKILLISLFLILSLSYGNNLFDGYKQRVGAEPVTSSTEKKKPVSRSYLFTDEIKAIHALHKNTFESSQEFSQRVNAEILKRYEDMAFYVQRGSEKYSAGTIKMKHYDPDSQVMTVTLNWNKNVKNCLAQSSDFKTIFFKISREKAEKFFGQKKKNYFHVKLQYKHHQLEISKIFFMNYLLYVNIDMKPVKSNNHKTDNVEQKREKPQYSKKVECKNYLVSATRLNVRSEPSRRSRSLASVSKNELVCVYEFFDGWAKIKNGWISAQYIKPQSKPETKSNSQTEYAETSSPVHVAKEEGFFSKYWWIILLLVLMFSPK